MSELATDKRQAGYVRVYRSLLDHPLTDQLPAAWFRVFIVILLKTNWKPGVWWDGHREITIPPGSLVTSVDKLRRLSKVSVKQVRGCLKYLAAANIAAIRTANQYTIITVTNWELYQDNDASEGKPDGTVEGKPRANEGQTEGKAGATIKEFNHSSIEENPLIDYSSDFAKTAKSNESDASRFSEPQNQNQLRTGLTEYISGSRFLAPPVPETALQVIGESLGSETPASFLRYLEQTESRYRPGGKAEPRSWGWFIRTAKNFAQTPPTTTFTDIAEEPPF